MWTPWEPVTAEIEGDHLAPVVWRNRLYLFWVTFMDKPDDSAPPNSGTGSKPLAEATLAQVASHATQAGKKKTIEIQLHWSEYLQGEWSTPRLGDFTPVTTMVVDSAFPTTSGEFTLMAKSFDGLINPAVLMTVPVMVPLSFDYKSVLIHVSKGTFENGEEGGVYIQLDEPINQGFYLEGRNSLPARAGYRSAPAMPYSKSDVNATRYLGKGGLTVSFAQRIRTEDGKSPVDTVVALKILQQGVQHTLLPCDNNITLGAPDVEALDASDPEAVVKAIETGLREIASLTKPIFYQDNTHTFFVEPNVAERTIEEWQEWVTRTPLPEQDWERPDWWKDIDLIAAIPTHRAPILIEPGEDGGQFPIGPEALISIKASQDWLVNPSTGLLFDGEVIGPGGRAELAVLSSAEAGGALASGGKPVNVNAGSGLVSGSTVVATAGNRLDHGGLTHTTGGLNVVGSGGFNSALA